MQIESRSVSGSSCRPDPGSFPDRLGNSPDGRADARTTLSADLLFEIVELAGDAMVVVDRTTRIVLFNRAAERVFGYTAPEMVGRSIHQLLPERFRGNHGSQMAEFRNHYAGPRLMGERQHIIGQRKDGSEFQAEASIACAGSGDGAMFVIVLRDITDRLRAEQHMARLGRIIEYSVNEIYVFDATTSKFEMVNRGAQENLGYSAEEMRMLTPLDIAPTFTVESFEELVRPLIDGTQEQLEFETIFQRKNGSTYEVEVRLQFMKMENPPVFVAIIRDITERTQFQTLIQRQSHYDALTLLPNRSLFFEKLSQTIDETLRGAGLGAVLVIDMANFRLVVDSLGQADADRLIQELARRLTNGLRPSDMLARLEGAEFAVIAPDLDLPEHAGALAERLLAAMEKPVDLGGYNITLLPAVGIAIFPDNGIDPLALVRNANAAMGRARESDEVRYCFYTADLNEAVRGRIALKSALSRALERDEFSLVYQPKVDLASWTVCGCEALLRWNSVDLGAVSPAIFIPELEDTGMIIPVGEWVLETACRQRRALIDRGFPAVRMAINLSVRQIRPTLPASVADILGRYDLAPDDIELEITESVFIRDGQSNIALLHELSDMGLHLALDDFGSGYSSLGYLKRLPLETVKIDRSLVTDIATDPKDAEIVRAIIAMGHTLNRRIVAKGVETQQQLSQLRRLDCDVIQGYFFSRPLPEPELMKFLARMPVVSAE